MQPEVSVVITCFNYEKYVAACLRSVLTQTFHNFEVIVVNDGSTDNSEKQIKPFLDDPRITYILQKNQGQANAKNRGIQESRGCFVAFLDADDQWAPEKLEKQLSLFKNEDVGVVYSRARYVDENGKDLNIEIDKISSHLAPQRGRVTENLLFDNFVPFSSSIVRRELLQDGFDESIKMAIDWKLWLDLSLSCNFQYTDNKLLIYRMGHSGQMSKNAEERFRCTDKILDKFLAKNRHKLNDSIVKEALAHKYYLRWEYFLGKDSQLAKNYLKLAIKQKRYPLRILKRYIKNWLLPNRISS